MSCNWKPVTLGDVVNLTTGFPFKSELYTTDLDSVRLLRGDNVGQGYLRWGGVKFWPRRLADDFAAYRLIRGDIILAMDRPWIEAGLKFASVREADLPSLLVQRVARLRGTEELDSRFLQYVIGSPEFTQHVLAVQTGTAVPHISGPQIKEYKFLLPPLSEQRAIAHILGTLDDKIELNRRMNETLEEIARTIFTSWFVTFDPVRAKAEGRQPEGMDAETAALFPDSFVDSELGEIPSGWEVRSLGSICNAAIGGDWGQEEGAEGFVQVACLRGVDLEHLRTRGEAPSAPMRWIKKSSLERRRMSSCDVLIAGSGAGPTGRPLLMVDSVAMQFDKPLIYSNFCKRLTCPSPELAAYLDRWLFEMRESGEIWSFVNGTSVPNLNLPGLLTGKSIVLPSEAILKRFTRILSPIYDKLFSGENRTLAQIRDTLLPKLLSGEIRVKDAESLVSSHV